MFSSTLKSVLVAFAVAAATVSASPSLSLTLAGPKSVQGVQNLKVAATITNDGDKAVKILDDPRSLISTRPVNKFAISNSKGHSPAFNGIKVKYSPAAAAKLGAFTVLAPGASITVTHDLSEAYNFTNTGVDSYDFEGDSTFYLVGDNNEIEAVHAHQPSAFTAKLNGNLAVARREPSRPGLIKRATFTGCSATRQSQIKDAIVAAEKYAADALSYLKNHTSTTPRYTTWFGTWSSSRYNTVVSHYTKIDGNTFDSFTFDCACTDSSYAYVQPSRFGVIHFCNAFWQAPTTGTDSKAGTIIHESSHFTSNGGTDDYAYGQTNAKALAKSDPSRAIFNADNHEYFAENNPTLA